MKTRHEIIVDVSPAAAWTTFTASHNLDRWQFDATDRRKPVFLAGTRNGNGVRAVIVVRFEAVDSSRTLVSVYANHRFRGLRRVTALATVFGTSRGVGQELDDLLQRFKLEAESAAGASRS